MRTPADAADRPVTPFSTWKHWGMAGILTFVLGGAIGFAVGQFGGGQRGWAAGFLTGALVALTRICRPLWHLRWFWMVVVVFVILDTVAVAVTDWSFSEHWTGHSFGGLMSLDIYAMLGTVYGLYRLIYGRPKHAFQEDDADLPNYSQKDLNI